MSARLAELPAIHHRRSLRSGAGLHRQRMPVAASQRGVCLLGVRIIIAFNMCSTVQVDKKLGFGRTLCGFRWRVVGRGKARFLAITAKVSASPPRPADAERLRKNAAPLRWPRDAGQKMESRTDLGGLTRSFQQGASQALQLAARAPLRARPHAK